MRNWIGTIRTDRNDPYVKRIPQSLSLPRGRRRTRVKLLGSIPVLAVVLVVAAFRQVREQENQQRDWEVQSAQTRDTQPADQRAAERTVFGGHRSPVDEVWSPGRTVTPKERGASSSERIRTAPAGAPASSSHSIPNDVQAFLNRWRITLVAGDAAGQAALYADRVDKFFTKRNVSREDVRREKERMLSRYPEFHKYDIREVRIERLNDDRAVLTFRKDWDARGRGRFSGSEQQRLTLSKQSGSWQIVGEEETKVHWVRRS
jgi:uncharacterized protein (TIGR02246 family)